MSEKGILSKLHARRWLWWALGATFLLCSCCTLVGILAPKESSSITPTETAQAQPSHTPLVSPTPAPPTPTASPTATRTPKPTATPTPTPSPTPTPIVIEGQGADVVDLPGAPYDMPVLVSIEGNQAGRYFGVTAYDADGQMIDLLVNTTEPYKGTRLVLDPAFTTLEIDAVGPWTIEVKDFLSYVPIIECNDTYSGTGDDVFVVRCEHPIDKAHIVGNESARYFGVTVYSIGNPGDFDLLVNTTEPFDGRKLLRRLEPPLIFEVVAVGPWTITLEP